MLQEATQLLDQVDWSRTRAYALGLNGLYVNLQGREREGVVAPGDQYEALLDELEAELLAMRDPHTGLSPVSRVDPSGAGFPREIFVVNDLPWSGDHCGDHRLVPGVLLTNRKITLEEPALHDLAMTILAEWGIAPLPRMIGRNLREPRPASSAAAAR